MSDKRGRALAAVLMSCGGMMEGEVQTVTAALECELHIRHTPRQHVNMWHFIHPPALGGEDVRENKVVACPTGHFNVHKLLSIMLERGMAVLPYVDIRSYTPEEIKYATLGYDAVQRYRAAKEQQLL